MFEQSYIFGICDKAVGITLTRRVHNASRFNSLLCQAFVTMAMVTCYLYSLYLSYLTNKIWVIIVLNVNSGLL